MLPNDLLDVTNNVIGEFVAAALLFILGYISRGLVSRIKEVRKNELLRARQQQVLPKNTAKWLIQYYLDRNRLDDLYAVKFDGKHRYIPFLTKPAWHDEPLNEDLIVNRSAVLPRSKARVNKRIIKKRKHLIGLDNNGRLWDDPILCVSSIATEGRPRLTVELANYFQYLSACGGVEEETYNAINWPGRLTPLRDNFVSDVDTLSSCGLKAHGMGMQVAFVYKDTDDYKILIQRRVFSVATYGGALAVVPTFGCLPVGGESESEISLLHNFLREFYEELYSSPEVERESSHIDPKWFYHVDPVSSLVALHDSGDFVFEILGVGFDALNGEVNIAALALINDIEFMRRQISMMKANWEINNIYPISINSPQLQDDILNYQFQPGSAFAITKALQRLNERYAVTSEV
ncbi:MAG TPA: hypothetical protein VF668_04880 [Pyrinomonadaceae bacterium]|jgi:hypothetical protein